MRDPTLMRRFRVCGHLLVRFFQKEIAILTFTRYEARV